jgi:hypothetical protein
MARSVGSHTEGDTHGHQHSERESSEGKDDPSTASCLGGVWHATVKLGLDLSFLDFYISHPSALPFLSDF